MHRYDFHCADCDEDFELTRAIRDRRLPAQCPSCGQGQTHRRYTGLSLIRRSSPTAREEREEGAIRRPGIQLENVTAACCGGAGFHFAGGESYGENLRAFGNEGGNIRTSGDAKVHIRGLETDD